MERRTKLAIKQKLSRVGFLTLRDGTVEVQGDNKPEFKDLKHPATLLSDMEQVFELGSKFSKPDYFLPITVAEGLHSADKMQTSGI